MAAIAIPRLGGFRGAADDAALVAEAKVLTSASQMYAANSANNQFPTAANNDAVVALLVAGNFVAAADYPAAKVALLNYDSATGIWTVK